jgi:hypothetical protein
MWWLAVAPVTWMRADKKRAMPLKPSHDLPTLNLCRTES